MHFLKIPPSSYEELEFLTERFLSTAEAHGLEGIGSTWNLKPVLQHPGVFSLEMTTQKERTLVCILFAKCDSRLTCTRLRKCWMHIEALSAAKGFLLLRPKTSSKH